MRREKKRGQNKLYGYGLLLVLFGGAGLSEVICSNRGSFLISAIVFGLGFAMVLWSYT